MGQVPAVRLASPGMEKHGKETSLEVVTPEGAQSLQGHTFAPSLLSSLTPFDTRGKGAWMTWKPTL